MGRPRRRWLQALPLAALAALAQVPAPAGAYLGVSTVLSRNAGRPWFDSPGRLATDAAGNLYVSDSPSLTVRKFSPSGEFLLSFGRATPATAPADGEFRSIGGMAVDQRSGEVYVTDPIANRVQKFSAEGRFLARWGRNGGDGTGGRGPGEFEDPVAVGVAGAGSVYVSDGVGGPVVTRSRIQKFTSTGQFLTQWEVGLPPVFGLAMDAFGTVYAANDVAGVVKYDPSGNYLGNIRPAPLSFPPQGRSIDYPAAADVGIDPGDGGVWFSDPTANRLEKHTRDGTLVAVCQPRIPQPDVFPSRQGELAVAPNGDVYTKALRNLADPSSAIPEIVRITEVTAPALACDPLPRISRASMEPTEFRAAPTPRSGARGAYIVYEIDQGGRAQAIIDYGFPGRRLGRNCVRTRGHRHARRCIAYRRIGKLVFGQSRRYGDAVRFYGWLNGRRMTPGAYRLRLTASDFRGRHSPQVLVPFTLAR